MLVQDDSSRTGAAQTVEKDIARLAINTQNIPACANLIILFLQPFATRLLTDSLVLTGLARLLSSCQKGGYRSQLGLQFIYLSRQAGPAQHQHYSVVIQSITAHVSQPAMPNLCAQQCFTCPEFLAYWHPIHQSDATVKRTMTCVQGRCLRTAGIGLLYTTWARVRQCPSRCRKLVSANCNSRYRSLDPTPVLCELLYFGSLIRKHLLQVLVSLC